MGPVPLPGPRSLSPLLRADAGREPAQTPAHANRLQGLASVFADAADELAPEEAGEPAWTMSAPPRLPAQEDAKASAVRLAGGAHPEPNDFSHLMEAPVERGDERNVKIVRSFNLKQSVTAANVLGTTRAAIDALGTDWNAAIACLQALQRCKFTNLRIGGTDRVDPDVAVYASAVRVCLRAGRRDKAMDLIEHAQTQGPLLSVPIALPALRKAMIKVFIEDAQRTSAQQAGDAASQVVPEPASAHSPQGCNDFDHLLEAPGQSEDEMTAELVQRFKQGEIDAGQVLQGIHCALFVEKTGASPLQHCRL